MRLSANMVNPLGEDVFIGDPEGEPYAVRISGEHHIPVSVLIYAKSADKAMEAVIDALINIADAQDEKARRYAEFHGYVYDALTSKKVRGVLESIKNGELTVDVELFDKRYLAKVVWAHNETLA